jgi:hypothetical protein
MQGLLFLSRVTFICNLFFIICLLLRHTHFTLPAALNEFVVLAGWILSVLLNFIFTTATVLVGVIKKNLLVPFWLISVNTFFFLFQLIYRFIFTY